MIEINNDHLIPEGTSPRLNSIIGVTREALAPYPEYSSLVSKLETLWQVAYYVLLKTDMIVSPLVHPVVVFLFVLEVGVKRHLSVESMEHLLALAILHDSPAEEKISKRQVRDLRDIDPQGAEILDARRRMARIKHMGSSMAGAVELLDLTHHIMGEVAFQGAEQITLDCGAHDLTSLNRPLPKDSSLLSLFCRCDCLWMLSYKHGPFTDLNREGREISPPNIIRQLKNNLSSVASRCGVAEPEDFHLTGLEETDQIARRHLAKWADELHIDSYDFFEEIKK